MPPIIGITASQVTNSYGQDAVELKQAYVDAIAQAGGVPVVIPSSLADDGWETIYARLDGILFSGGGDIAADHFGGEPHPRIDDVDPSRDSVELSLLHEAAAGGKPFLGICRGIQLVNVALGGTLYTHIPDQLPGALDHAYPGNMRQVLVHEVQIDEGTLAASVLAEPIVRVNSHHHQGLKDIATELRVAGRAPDGLVEVVELPQHPFGLAVQWHPEWLTGQQSTRNLFHRFVQAAERGN
ncbi:MAG TPA: gamma-glutamyl-gamma-aminobutyrate hydrolase family protein [Anaerolineales bacterium]|nr:gamma-glutamyl-gamma-aminobutyrate hydrolase family protein [Anaerolineales bacterium]